MAIKNSNSDNGSKQPQSIVKYLKDQLNTLGDFYAEWKLLSAEDKVTLRRWAKEEMEYLGIVIVAK
jgi:hypothetical protein